MDKHLKDFLKQPLCVNIRRTVSTTDLPEYLSKHPGSCAVATKWVTGEITFNSWSTDYHSFPKYIVLDYSSDFLNNAKFIMYQTTNSSSSEVLTLSQAKKIDTSWYIQDKPKLCSDELAYLAFFNIYSFPSMAGDCFFFIKVLCSGGTEQLRCCYERYSYPSARVRKRTWTSVPGPRFKKDVLFKWMNYTKGYSIEGKEITHFKNYSWLDVL